MRSTQYVLLSLSLLCLVGCDKSGIHPLGRIRDTLGVCTTPTVTWVRTTPTATEVFIMGEPGDAGEPGCFAHAMIDHDSTTHMEFGSLTREGGESATFAYTAEYDFQYEPERGLLSRQGSIRIDHDPPISVPMTFVPDGTELLITMSGETRRTTSMLDVIDRLSGDTMEGAIDVFCVYNLPLFTSQTRMLGFGSSGMTQYLDVTATFKGAIANVFTVHVAEILNPVTDITYVEFQDLNGITHDGNIHSVVDLTGNGNMRDIVTFRLEGNVKQISGAMDYRDLLIRNGVAGDGVYQMTIEDGGTFTYELPYTFAAEVDIRNVLPESTP